MQRENHSRKDLGDHGWNATIIASDLKKQQEKSFEDEFMFFIGKRSISIEESLFEFI